MAAAKVVAAVTPFSATVKDELHQVHEGDRFASTHPLVAHAPELFRPEDPDVQAPSPAERTQRKRRAP